MRIDIISVVPELLTGPFNSSIIKKAIDKKIIEIHIHNLRDYSTNNYRSIDDYQYGGGAGMVMLIEPIDNCIVELKKERDYDQIIYMTPVGETLNQGISNKWKGDLHMKYCTFYQNWDAFMLKDHPPNSY